MTRRGDDYDTVARLLRDLYEPMFEADGEACAIIVIDTGIFEDDGVAEAQAEAALAQVNAVIEPDFRAYWTGLTTGETGFDVRIEYVGPDQAGRYTDDEE